MARTMMGSGLLLGRPRSGACAHAGHVSRKRIPFTAPTSASCQVTSGGQLFHHERFSRCASKSCRGFIGIPNTIFRYSSRGNLLSASAWRSDRITRCRWLKTATAISKSDAWRLHFGERGGRMHERDAPWREPWPRRRGFPLLSKVRRGALQRQRDVSSTPCPRQSASCCDEPQLARPAIRPPSLGPRSKLEVRLAAAPSGAT